MAARTGQTGDAPAGAIPVTETAGDSIVQPDDGRTELERSNARLYVLAEVSHAFAMVATDHDSLLARIARTTADLVGDGCIVTLLAPDGDTLFNAANAHRNPALEDDYRTYLAGKSISRATSPQISAIVARTGMPKLVREVDPATMVAQAEEPLKPLVARLDVRSFAVVPIRARGAILGTLSLVRSGPGRGYSLEDLTLLQDLADRAGLAIENARLYRELEARVRERTAALERANEELETFSYTVAHDLRSPLRAIDGYAQVLIEDHGDRLEAAGREPLDRIRAASHRMSELIDDLLGLAKISRAPLARQRVDLSAIAGTIADSLQSRAPGRRVELAIAPDLAAQADPALMKIALENLLGNAWKFSAGRDPAHVTVGRADTAEGPAFFVRDDGAGFDMAHQAQLFQPFHRLHRDSEFEGTGIGLATVHRIVTRHGGRIWPDATPGAGATFFFTLGEAD